MTMKTELEKKEEKRWMGKNEAEEGWIKQEGVKKSGEKTMKLKEGVNRMGGKL